MPMNRRSLPFHIRTLQAELERRRAINPRYSLRAFASALSWHPSALSRILSGKQEISVGACSDVLRVLRFPVDQARLFLASIAQEKRTAADALLNDALKIHYGDSELSDSSSHPGLAPLDLSIQQSLSATSELICVMDLNWRFLQTSHSLSSKSMYSQAELVGRNWRDTNLSAEFTEILERQEKNHQHSLGEGNFRFSVDCGDAKKFYQRLIVPVNDTDGIVRSYVSYIRDLTWEIFALNAVESMHSSIEWDQTIKAVAEAGIPMLGKACVLQLVTSAGNLMPVAAVHEDSRMNQELLEVASSINTKYKYDSQNPPSDKIFEVVEMKASVGSFEASKLINIQLQIRSQNVGLLSYITRANRPVSADQSFAIARIQQAASQAIVNAQYLKLVEMAKA